MRNKGFTLIELLVVIAIIGMLSSVVLASLNAARGRGADSAVKAAMRQLAIQAQNYLDTGASNFGTSLSGACSSISGSNLFTNTQFVAIRVNIEANDAPGAAVNCSTDSTGTKWAVSTSALKGAGTSWCIDSSQGWFKPGSSSSGICS